MTAETCLKICQNHELTPFRTDPFQQDEHTAVRQAAVQELARGWKDDPDTLAFLKSRAQQDEHAAVRQAAVQLLARGWKDDPEVQKFLNDLEVKAPS